ncbi:MAG: hypothetical protein ACFE89_03635 [Candidatus Hodarchaeota archaeon]
MIVLEYQDGTFIESKQGAGGIRCEVDKTSKKINVIMPQGTNLIERRTALRLADTIARSGYLLSTGERVGQGYQLVIDEKGSAIPERLKVSPRISYSTTTKPE